MLSDFSAPRLACRTGTTVTPREVGRPGGRRAREVSLGHAAFEAPSCGSQVDRWIPGLEARGQV